MVAPRAKPVVPTGSPTRGEHPVPEDQFTQRARTRGPLGSDRGGNIHGTKRDFGKFGIGDH